MGDTQIHKADLGVTAGKKTVGGDSLHAFC